MRNPARILTLLVLVSALCAPAHAAARCPMVVDPKGDAGQASPYAPDEAGDVVAVEVTADRTTVTVTLTLAALDDADVREIGHLYEVYLDDGESGRDFEAVLDGLSPEYKLTVNRPPGGTGASLRGRELGPVEGVVDRSRHQVRMTAPLSLVGWKIGHRARLSAVTWQSAGSPGAGPVARDSFIASSDFTDASLPYRFGARGCP